MAIIIVCNQMQIYMNLRMCTCAAGLSVLALLVQADYVYIMALDCCRNYCKKGIRTGHEKHPS